MKNSILFVAIVATLAMSSLVFAQRPGGGRGGQGAGGQGGPGGQPPASPLLAALDVDHDGKLSAEEIAGAAEQLRTLDKNKDGVLDVSEMAPSRGSAGGSRGGRGQGGGGGGRGGDPAERINRMMQLDADGNGEISKEEGGERMSRFFGFMDGDGNGSLTREEIETAMKNRGGGGRGGAGGGRGAAGGGQPGAKKDRPAFEE